MEQLEKVEKLRERADVSYEEGERGPGGPATGIFWTPWYGWKKEGKRKGPSKESFTTSYEEQDQYVSVKDKVQEQERE